VSSKPRSNNRTAAAMAVMGLVMLGLAFASVPLYRVFCQVTGYGGTTQRSEVAPGAVATDAKVSVRFDANVNDKLPWKFEPEQESVRVVPGAPTKIFYRAQNMVARPTTGQAVFNVSPAEVGKYFSKIECFCFTEQTLKGGQGVDMPVVFFVDPKVRTDPDTKDVDEITLSYTFYPVETDGSAS
jgi:cytochrome c oxidase assembly protein subunit 11